MQSTFLEQAILGRIRLVILWSKICRFQNKCRPMKYAIQMSADPHTGVKFILFQIQYATKSLRVFIKKNLGNQKWHFYSLGAKNEGVVSTPQLILKTPKIFIRWDGEMAQPLMAKFTINKKWFSSRTISSFFFSPTLGSN